MGFVWPHIHHKIIPQDMFSPAILPDDKIDSDLDGRPDYLDACPNERENFDGYRDGDGCPDDKNAFERCTQNKDRISLEEYVCIDEHDVHPIPYELGKQKCEKQGGEWIWGESQFCRMPVDDEGKQCTDSFQCEDICKAEANDDTSGICTAFSGGCNIVMHDGKTSMLCS